MDEKRFVEPIKRLQSRQGVFLSTGAGSCGISASVPHHQTWLGFVWHKSLDIFRFGCFWFLCPSCFEWQLWLTQTEQEEENWLILVIAPICFSAVVNSLSPPLKIDLSTSVQSKSSNCQSGRQLSKQSLTRRRLRRLSSGFSKCKKLHILKISLIIEYSLYNDALKKNRFINKSGQTVDILVFLYFPSWVWYSNTFISEGELQIFIFGIYVLTVNLMVSCRKDKSVKLMWPEDEYELEFPTQQVQVYRLSSPITPHTL